MEEEVIKIECLKRCMKSQVEVTLMEKLVRVGAMICGLIRHFSVFRLSVSSICVSITI